MIAAELTANPFGKYQVYVLKYAAEKTSRAKIQTVECEPGRFNVLRQRSAPNVDGASD
jgi:hypothetical protein